jgi:16S rRNA (cytosine1402-N4)-methyltransferase
MPSQDEEKGRVHEPVLLTEVIYWLQPQRGGTFIDCTLGLGGHAEVLLECSPEAKVIGIDQDLQALRIAEQRLARFKDRFQSLHANFGDLPAVMSEMSIAGVQGIMADLGVSSLQLDASERGFSFLSDAPLDMRMDQSGGPMAADLVNELTEQELADLIFEYGEERGARKIARAVVRERQKQPIATTRQLADLVVRALNIPGRWRIHPATRTFQALRIAVNDELNVLTMFIPAAISLLAGGGRLAIISFHSLEDRIVKRSFQREAGRCICQAEIIAARGSGSHRGTGSRRAARAPLISGGGRQSDSDDSVCDRCGARARVRILTRKPVRPSEEELERNLRSRSALLRVCERLQVTGQNFSPQIIR